MKKAGIIIIGFIMVLLNCALVRAATTQEQWTMTAASVNTAVQTEAGIKFTGNPSEAEKIGGVYNTPVDPKNFAVELTIDKRGGLEDKGKDSWFGLIISNNKDLFTYDDPNKTKCMAILFRPMSKGVKIHVNTQTATLNTQSKTYFSLVDEYVQEADFKGKVVIAMKDGKLYYNGIKCESDGVKASKEFDTKAFLSSNIYPGGKAHLQILAYDAEGRSVNFTVNNISKTIEYNPGAGAKVSPAAPETKKNDNSAKTNDAASSTGAASQETKNKADATKEMGTAAGAEEKKDNQKAGNSTASASTTGESAVAGTTRQEPSNAEVSTDVNTDTVANSSSNEGSGKEVKNNSNTLSGTKNKVSSSTIIAVVAITLILVAAAGVIIVKRKKGGIRK